MRRHLYILSTLAIFCSLLCFASGPADRQPTDPKSISSQSNPSAKPVPIDDLFFSRRVSSPAWSPDGKTIVFTTNLTGRNNLWLVNSNGGWPLQLTVSDDRQNSATFSRDGKWIVYQQDFGGHEYYDVFAVPSGGGTPINITNTPDISETDPTFSPDGKSLALNYKPKTASSTDVAIMNWNSRRLKKLTNEQSKDHEWSLVDWSPDGRYIYANRIFVGFTDASVFRIDVATGQQEELTPHQGQATILARSVSSDGNTVSITSNQKGGYNNAGLLDVASKRITWITDTQWDATAGDFSRDGKRVTYDINADGVDMLHIYDIASKKSVTVPMPVGLTSTAGNPTAFSPDGKSLIVVHQDPQRPSDFWIYDLASGKPRQLTYSAIAGLNPSDLPSAQVISYKSFDGQMISAFLWMPYNLKRDASNPAVVLPHGGPAGQMTAYFNSTAAALSSRGYVCIAPNVRGSTGYGVEFQKGNYQDLGGGDLQDEVYATKFLIDSGYVDAKKIGITGGSYGGFMTLMAVGRTPDVWAAAVEQYGIIDWYTMLQHEDPMLQQYERTLLGDPEKDRAKYEASSPIKYIRDEKAPLLVLQGENDIRVPKEEAEQVVEILKKEGRTVDAHYYPAEGHGFSKRENQIDALKRTVAWFDKYLKGESASTAATTGQ